ncbi:hypothetical protein [Oceanirhabdus seepicola]|uniref:Uncharacterized protein n=1 Tax=Oceanirhabdus seepicola TaxID=2828781 RepID=A0A9J6PAI9_9CLOT|nr:hypothetical protein [Oceanirhabdus seepicola]MCM1992365.1 hypothetical protein [Oceanirhabdus seepicola]
MFFVYRIPPAKLLMVLIFTLTKERLLVLLENIDVVKQQGEGNMPEMVEIKKN